MKLMSTDSNVARPGNSRSPCSAWLAVAAFAVLGLTHAGADYEVSRATIDGGGGMFSTGGAFDLSGSIGQCDAGTLSGGTFTLTGGFWFGLSPGDCDADGDVDLDDYKHFAGCLGGPGGGLGTGCGCFDFDGSGDVDLFDFADFQVVFTGL